MSDESTARASITLRPTHGTATPHTFPSIIPIDKRDCESFWVRALLSKLDDFNESEFIIQIPSDDSHGKHDIVIHSENDETIGIQVTELTYELERERNSHRNNFVNSVLKSIHSASIVSTAKIAITCHIPCTSSRQFHLPPMKKLIETIQIGINQASPSCSMVVEESTLHFTQVDIGNFHMPFTGNIGFDCSIDQLPRTLQMYLDAATCIRDKKTNSISKWLLIWSKSFWRDRHWVENETIQHMSNIFNNSNFEKVFFIESMDGPGFFQANLHNHFIKA